MMDSQFKSDARARNMCTSICERITDEARAGIYARTISVTASGNFATQTQLQFGLAPNVGNPVTVQRKKLFLMYYQCMYYILK